jgi:hypothetical protein
MSDERTWADDVADEQAAAPAENATADAVPPADEAGAANDAEPEYPPGVVPAGQPVLEEDNGPQIENPIRLKTAPPHGALEVIGAEAVDFEYRDFTEQQAAALRTAAQQSGVTLITEGEEEASGEASA